MQKFDTDQKHSDGVVFSTARKRPIVRFHTSNIDKFLQARAVFRLSEITLRYFKESQDPYHEDYELGQEALLVKALDEIRSRVGANSLFFVEDTSVRVEAFSTERKSFPGLRVKEWFKGTNFEELDRDLRVKSNDRRATVFSDIALYVPGLGKPIFVRGRTTGVIADTAPSFDENETAPWLTPSTFNGWFVPEGSSKRLGQMLFEESLSYDFRVKALKQLIERLEEFCVILNLPHRAYEDVGENIVSGDDVRSSRLSLFSDFPLLVVVGRMCAGKTTLGQYVASQHGGLHIEASKVMRELAAEGEIDSHQAQWAAREVLGRMGSDVVAREIVHRFGRRLERGAVVTGFRTLEEIEYIRKQYPSCRVVAVETGDRTRFGRHLDRDRSKEIRTYDEFVRHDRTQWKFGLLGRVLDVADLKVENEGTLDQYYGQIDALLAGNYRSIGGLSKVNLNIDRLKESRLYRCLRALEDIGRPASCKEIEQMSKRVKGKTTAWQRDRVNCRHVNWVLKGVPELARRIKQGRETISYDILPAGRAYLRVVQSNAWTHG